MTFKITFLSLLVSFSIFSQNITARLIDKKMQQPIPFASIKTGEYDGVISNDEGFFTIQYSDENKTIIISCMGYENKTLSIKDIKLLDLVIELNESINQLDEIYISNGAPNADSIIAKVKAKLAENYNFDLNQYNIFHRTTDHVDFKTLEFEIDKASDVKRKQLENVNNNLNALVNQVKNSNMVQFVDFKGKAYTLDRDSIKIEVEKATELLDAKNNFSIDNIQEKMQTIILKYLDTTKTYKLKTGLFTIEDSLSLKNNDSIKKNEHERQLSYLNIQTKSLLKHAQFYEDSFLNNILNTNWYDYEVKAIGTNNGELTYIISFIPKKGKAKYTGEIYVSDNTYAVTRTNYEYYKNRHGEKLNLRLVLGVKYNANVSEGTIIFEKDSSNTYHPKYINRTTGSYFFVSRPLKFIENSSNRYKVSFDFTIEGDTNNKEELLITGNKPITLLDFQAEKQAKKTPILKLNTYEKTIWDNESVLEPSLEMKGFKVEN